MTTLRRHFRKDGPNYAPSGLDTPIRDAERKHVNAAMLGSFFEWEMEASPERIERHLQFMRNTFGSEQGAGLRVSPAPCSSRSET